MSKNSNFQKKRPDPESDHDEEEEQSKPKSKGPSQNNKGSGSKGKPKGKPPGKSSGSKSDSKGQPRQKPTLAPPKSENKEVTQSTKDEPMWKESIFGAEMSSRETSTRTSFQPTLSSYMPTIQTTFRQLMVDDPSLGKLLTVDAFQYYCVALQWLRIVDVKDKTAQTFSQNERQLKSLTETLPFTIPEPIYLYLKGIGTVITPTGEHLFPTFPELPVTVIGPNGGYYGVIDDANHNLYEEIACLGVAAEQLRASQGEANGAYASQLAPQNFLANSNLLGYNNLVYRRNEARATLQAIGITDQDFPQTIQNTGFNLDAVLTISNIVRNTKSFKNFDTTINAMGETGSLAQTVITRPQNVIFPIRNVSGDVIPSALYKASNSTFGIAVTFEYQLFKESAVAGGNQAHTPWYCLTPQAQQAVPQARIANRNARRNIPVRYLSEVFQAPSQNADEYRNKVINSLIVAKR